MASPYYKKNYWAKNQELYLHHQQMVFEPEPLGLNDPHSVERARVRERERERENETQKISTAEINRLQVSDSKERSSEFKIEL